MSSYTAPVDKLLTYGYPEEFEAKDWPDYLADGIGTEHISDLLRMLLDPELRTTDPDNTDPKYWGPVYAWRTLAQLHDASVLAPILDQAENLIDEEKGFSDWAMDELPEVIEMIGPTSIPIAVNYLADAAQSKDVRAITSNGLTRIAQKYPETREEIISIFSKQLEHFEENHTEINAIFIAELGRLHAVETLPLIQKAFESNTVDEFFITLEDIEVMFGLKEKPEAPFPFNNRVSHEKQPAPTWPSETFQEQKLGATDTGFGTNKKGISKQRLVKKAKNKVSKAARKKNKEQKKK